MHLKLLVLSLIWCLNWKYKEWNNIIHYFPHEYYGYLLQTDGYKYKCRHMHIHIYVHTYIHTYIHVVKCLSVFLRLLFPHRNYRHWLLVPLRCWLSGVHRRLTSAYFWLVFKIKWWRRYLSHVRIQQCSLHVRWVFRSRYSDISVLDVEIQMKGRKKGSVQGTSKF